MSQKQILMIEFCKIILMIFLNERKKYWLLPIIYCSSYCLVYLIVLSQGSAVAPFIYTIF